MNDELLQDVLDLNFNTNEVAWLRHKVWIFRNHTEAGNDIGVARCEGDIHGFCYALMLCGKIDNEFVMNNLENYLKYRWEK